ncbi:hypothetical protein [Actinomadura miaoliensis]|uniref:Uncharacterized protein n=1 Tax=Actinomadura miaoliensis TaxID=430685 RepID=A0ABP7UVB9_9ACTN
MRTGRTWWTLRRPGRVRASTVGAVDGARAATVWTDRRLTIIDAATGRRRHASLPDRAQDRARHGDAAADQAVVGLADRSGRPIAAVIQSRGVDAHDASSGHRLGADAEVCTRRDARLPRPRLPALFLRLTSSTSRAGASTARHLP